MSTGLECLFLPLAQQDATTWYYLLQDWDCPAGCWDWREHATAYGPFSSYDTACIHLANNHPNPGGHSIEDPTSLADLPGFLQTALQEASR